MSGHSKWASIKHQKGVADARRGQAFTKLANAVALAARSGADPTMNFKLKLAIQKAKQANMPAANIERSIQRGSGQLAGAQLDEVLYEGYGPSGVGILIEAATDNRNRTAAEVRSILSRHGGRMVESGSVSYQFTKAGVLSMATTSPDELMLEAIEAGASDVEESEGEIVAQTSPEKLDSLRTALVEGGADVLSAEIEYIPKTTIKVTDPKTAQTLMKLMTTLDELDDVTSTSANFDLEDYS